jgi:hypothetical protein
MVVSVSHKSGMGLSDGVVSELTVIWMVKPGHAEQLRAACKRFMDLVRDTDARATQKTGLRDIRVAMFEEDRRLLLATNFESDWDAYVRDIAMTFGADALADVFQHLEGFTRQALDGTGGFFQAHQVQATGYWNGLSDTTVPQIRKALRLEQAFQQVLDDPAAAQALQHPALKPLLDQAAD